MRSVLIFLHPSCMDPVRTPCLLVVQRQIVTDFYFVKRDISTLHRKVDNNPIITEHNDNRTNDNLFRKTDKL